MYRIVWRFEVAGEHAADFEREYGPDGSWERLFREAKGYSGTALFRSTSVPGEYLTLDSWESREDFDVFRRERSAEYEALDRRLEGLTLREERIAAGEEPPRERRIRLAVRQDAAELAGLMRRTFVEAFGAQNSPEDMETYAALSYGVEQQEREIAAPDYLTLVVEEGAKLIAFAQLRKRTSPAVPGRPDAVEIFRFYVDRPYHGRGVAPELMGAASRAAEALGATSVWLGVWEHNPRAIAFYRRCGFEIVGSQKFTIGSDVQNDHVMLASLPVKS